MLLSPCPAQDPATFFAKKRSKELATEIQNIFTSFDKDGNGSIDADELRDLASALGQVRLRPSPSAPSLSLWVGKIRC